MLTQLYKYLTLCLTALVMVSCTRNDPPPGVIGFWQGKFGVGNNNPTNGYCFIFRGDGTVRVFDNQDTTVANKAEGTYSFLGYDVTTKYTFLNGGDSYSSTAKINVRLSFMEGTWGRGNNTSGMGHFYINRQ